MFFFYCPSMAYKEILSQDVKTFSCIKEGNVNCPPLIDPRQGRAFCKVSIGHIFFLFLLGKNRHKMYLRHILCIKDIFNFEFSIIRMSLMKGMGSNKSNNAMQYVEQFCLFSGQVLFIPKFGPKCLNTLHLVHYFHINPANRTEISWVLSTCVQ